MKFPIFPMKLHRKLHRKIAPRGFRTKGTCQHLYVFMPEMHDEMLLYRLDFLQTKTNFLGFKPGYTHGKNLV